MSTAFKAQPGRIAYKESGRTAGNETIEMRTPALTIDGGLIVPVRWHWEAPRAKRNIILRTATWRPLEKYHQPEVLYGQAYREQSRCYKLGSSHRDFHFGGVCQYLLDEQSRDSLLGTHLKIVQTTPLRSFSLSWYLMRLPIDRLSPVLPR